MRQWVPECRHEQGPHSCYIHRQTEALRLMEQQNYMICASLPGCDFSVVALHLFEVCVFAANLGLCAPFCSCFWASKVARLTFKKTVYSHAGSWGIFFWHPWFLPDEKRRNYINASHCTHPSRLECLYSFSPPEVKTNHHLVILTPRHIGSFPPFPTRGSPGFLELQFSQLHLASPPLSSQSNTCGEVCPVIIDMFHTEKDAEGERRERGRMGRDGGWMWAELRASLLWDSRDSSV